MDSDDLIIQSLKNGAELQQQEDDDKEAALAIAATILVGVELARQDRIENRQPRRLYLCRPQLLPNPRKDTPWQVLFATQNNRAFITTMGLDVKTFSSILTSGFVKRWYNTPIPEFRDLALHKASKSVHVKTRKVYEGCLECRNGSSIERRQTTESAHIRRGMIMSADIAGVSGPKKSLSSVFCPSTASLAQAISVPMAARNDEDAEMIEARPRKRIRSSTKRKRATSPTHLPRVPILFAPFRALGLITNHIPFYIQTRSYKDATEGPRIHILTCLGRSWALWEGGPEVQDPISCLVMDGDAVWAASGVHVIKYLRGKEVSRVSNPLQTPLAFVILFGTQLLALTEDGARMLIWEVSTNEQALSTTIQFDIGFTATSILHPATYLNKVLVASKEGDMQLWNIRTQTCIHKFSNSLLRTLPSQQHMNSLSSPITALTQSPAIDVVGVGFMSGEISVYDVRADERLMRMYMDDGGIKALSFRSDGHPILASASSSGHIALGSRFWSALEWVPGQPVLISSGEDNSVKQWLYESPTAVPRLLKFRSGHHAPPHLIRFYGEDDSRSYEMSQGSLARKATTLSKPLTSLKFPPITSISCSSTRSKDWDDVLTAHADEMCVRSWTVLNKRVGKHTFNSAESSKRKSPSGVVKSGLKRKSFKVGPCPQALIDRLELSSMTRSKASERSITGLASDALNRAVIATTSDGTVNVRIPSPFTASDS
ncbi:WD40-repeat-containing domain protein [Suillus discolor]|uniref:WD40-repeat-containing domain protein n=1 Tax=Suillus discolor TaxID=1912936 RepID=A0A9P7JLB9_9AGAM|nr:WD40-repeat-containing domain protein [Suillus discolor]KAG2084691.1 WD40-repeat-containing domain protein [Suillus discolor]